MNEAVISECGKYRYVLRRKLDCVVRWYRPALFIMLNPSTADAELDDPTIRRCMAFAKREACSHLNVVNLFALRATNPKELQRVDDPIGIMNSVYLNDELEKHRDSLIVCAWGANSFAKHRANMFKIMAMKFDLSCLGKTKTGAPRHPLYIPSNQPLERYP